MSTITADPTLLLVLSQMKDATEIRDVDGNLLGTYMPTSLEEQSLYEKAKRLFDPTELERRKSETEGKGSSFEEVWKRMRAMESKQ